VLYFARNMEKSAEGKIDLIAFDIDGTLTRSKQPIEPYMVDLLCELLDRYKVAVISGAGFSQFKWQILDHLSCSFDRLNKLYLLPADGTLFCYGDKWQCDSDKPLSIEEKVRIRRAFENIFEAVGLERPDKIYGEQVEDRGAQLNFSAFGQDAPIELKESWDPDNKKRVRMVEVLKQSLSDFSIRIGGTTSIEVTRQGVDKAYGLNKLIDRTGIKKEKILYIGDKLFKGGNDEPALIMGLESRAVQGPEETKKVIQEFLG